MNLWVRCASRGSEPGICASLLCCLDPPCSGGPCGASMDRPDGTDSLSCALTHRGIDPFDERERLVPLPARQPTGYPCFPSQVLA
ncbi:hypothetical protein D3C85_1624710 [compost metagenome]